MRHLLHWTLYATLWMRLSSWCGSQVIASRVVAWALPRSNAACMLGTGLVVHGRASNYLIWVGLHCGLLHSVSRVFSWLIRCIPSEVMARFLINLEITGTWHDHSTSTLCLTLGPRWLICHLISNHLTSSCSIKSMSIWTIVLASDMLLIWNLR